MSAVERFKAKVSKIVGDHGGSLTPDEVLVSAREKAMCLVMDEIKEEMIRAKESELDVA